MPRPWWAGSSWRPASSTRSGGAHDAEPADVDAVRRDDGGRAVRDLAAQLFLGPLAEPGAVLGEVDVVGEAALVAGRRDRGVGEEVDVVEGRGADRDPLGGQHRVDAGVDAAAVGMRRGPPLQSLVGEPGALGQRDAMRRWPGRSGGTPGPGRARGRPSRWPAAGLGWRCPGRAPRLGGSRTPPRRPTAGSAGSPRRRRARRRRSGTPPTSPRPRTPRTARCWRAPPPRRRPRRPRASSAGCRPRCRPRRCRPRPRGPPAAG